MKVQKRQWQAREMRMVSEYLVKFYAKYPCYTRVRLGSIPSQLKVRTESLAEERMKGVWRRYADAVVVKPQQIVIIEASIRPDPGDISKLKLYKHLFPHTPEFQPYTNRPIALELVYAMPDVVLQQLARDEGIKVIKFKPDWLDDYLSILYPHERRAPLTNLSDLSG